MKQRTLLITSPYYPPLGGGLERYVENIVKHLSRDYHWRIVIVTAGQFRQADTKEERDGITIYRLGYSLRLSNTVLGFTWRRKLKHIIQAEQPDIVNAHAPVPGFVDIVSSLKLCVPLVITYHTSSMKKGNPADLLIAVYEKYLLPSTLKRATKIICASDYIKDGFLAAHEGKTLTITPGVNDKVFKPTHHRNLAEPMLLYVANYGPSYEHKGLTDAIHALALLKPKFPGIKLTVVGNGNPNHYAKLLSQLKLESDVIILPYQPITKLIELYNQSSVFVLPSRNESFGMVIAEAMACGTPVVATNIGGIPTLIDQDVTGLMVPPCDVPALTEAISQILANPDFGAKLGQAGYNKMRLHFSWVHKANNTHELFTKLLDSTNTANAYRPSRPRRITMLASGSIHSDLTHRILSFGTALAKQGHDVRIIAPRSDKYNGFSSAPPPNISPVKLISPFQFTTHNRIFNLLPYIPAAALAVLSRRCDVIYLYKPTPITIVGLLTKLVYLTPVVLDMDDIGSQVMASEGSSGFEVKLTGWCEELSEHQANAIVTASSLLQRHYATRHPTTPVTWVPNGVQASNFATTSVPSQTTAKLVFFGRLSRRDIMEPLIMVLPELIADFPDLKVIIIGNGEESEYLQHLARQLEVNDSITWTGWIKMYNAKNYICAGDIGYNFMPDSPSVKAASNLKIFQYMSMGALPLVSDIGDQAHYIDNGRAGYVAKAGDLTSLANTIRQALRESAAAKAEKIAYAQDLAINRYNWDNLAKLVDATIQKVSQ